MNQTPDSGSALNALGTVFLDQSQPDNAKTVFEKAAGLNSPHLTACYNLCRLKHIEGDDKGAIHIYRAIVKRQPQLGLAWNNLGVAQDEFHMIENASRSCQKTIEIQPDYASAHFNLGVSLQKRDRFKAAEDHYNKVLEIKPGDEAAHFAGLPQHPMPPRHRMYAGFWISVPGLLKRSW